MNRSRTDVLQRVPPGQGQGRVKAPAGDFGRPKAVLLVAFAALVLLPAARTQSQVVSLRPGQNLNWFDEGSWTPATIPGTGSDVVIAQGGGAVITPQTSGTVQVATARTLTLGSGTVTGALTISGSPVENVTTPAGLDLTLSTVKGIAVTINTGGTLNIGADGFLALTPSTILQNSGTINIDPAGSLGADRVILHDHGVINGNLTLGSSSSPNLTLDAIAAHDKLSQAVTGSIALPSNASVTKTSQGSWDIDKSLGSYAGGTNVSHGELWLFVSNPLGTGPVTVTSPGDGNVALLHLQPGVTLDNQVTLRNGATLDNYGTVTSTVLLGTGSNRVTNEVGGSIQVSGDTAVLAQGGTATLVNGNINGGATIQGTVVLGNFANTVRLFTGSQISGDLDLGTNVGTRLFLDGEGNQLLSQAVTGSITNSGSVIKENAGTWVIDASLGNYTGGTTISGGTLQLGNGGTTGEITGNVTDDASLVFDRSDTLTFAGVIIGTGSVTQAGTGTTILTGNSSYTGGTGISQGVLQLGNGGASGSITGNVTDNGVLVFDRSDAATFAGVISGSGSVQQNGVGTMILTGNSSYAGGTAISQGVLQLGNGGTSGSIAGDVTDNGSLVFDRADALAFTGTISGVGNVTQLGTGITILSGSNSYSGSTLISAGVLSAGATNAFSPNSAVTVGSGATLDLGGFNNTVGSLAGTGTVTNSGAAIATLSVGQDGTSRTFSGVIQDGSAPLALTKVGAGTLTLSGANTYSGGTTLNAGILAVSRDVNLGTGTLSFDGGTLEALGTGLTSPKAINLATAGGTFLADAGTNSTLNGAITGPGGWTKDGAGGLMLGGNNTYLGATLVNAGTLSAGSTTGFSPNSAVTVGSGATLDLGGFNNTVGSLAGTGTVTNNGTATATLSVGADNTSTTFGGVIQDGASTLGLTKIGAGTLTLANQNIYTGTTTINQGSLIVDGPLSTRNTVVNPNGTLGGRGSVGGPLENFGTVSPGDNGSPGTLTVNGNYLQQPGATLRIAVGGPGATGLLQVNGQATIAGGSLQLARTGNFQLQVGQKITFLNATGGVNGAFNTVQNEFATGTVVIGNVVQQSNSLLLQGTQGSFNAVVALSPTPNTAAVANMLNSAIGDPRAANLIAFLDREPLNQLPSDFQRISPDELTSTNNVGTSVTHAQTANVSQRIEQVRAGSTGFDATGFTVNGSTPGYSGGLAGPVGQEGKAGPAAVAPVPENRWGVFVTGLGEFTNVGSTANAAGFDLQTGGLTFGADYRLTPYLAVGLMGGYAHTGIDLSEGGSLDTDSGQIGLYATAFGSGFYADGAVTGGISGYDARRAGLQGTARGSTNGFDFSTLLSGGYDWKKGGLTVGPTARLQYAHVDVGGYTETGSLAPLDVGHQHTDSLRTALGARASYDWQVGHVLIKPEVRAAWQHEYLQTQYAVVSRLTSGAGASFSALGPDIGHDSLLIGAGVAFLLTERLSTYIYYDGEIGRANYESHNVSAGVRLTF